MTISVEDGTGKTDAVSYLSAADALAYHVAHGNDAWSDEDTATQEAALVRATTALDSWLRGSWSGKKKTQAQSLAWPRTGVTDEDGYTVIDTAVPLVIEQACAEVALIELTERFIQQSVDNSNAVASETVGPISVSYRADAPTNKRYPHIEAMLRGVAAVGAPQVSMNVYLTDAEKDALDDDGEFDPFKYDEYFAEIKGY